MLAGAAGGETLCDADDAGLKLADGYCARLFADGAGAVRNLAVAADGSVFATRRDKEEPAGLVLRDDDGDGRADRREAFAPDGPAHGVLVDAERVWLAYDRRVLRFPRRPGALAPGAPVAVVEGLPEQRSHAHKAIALGRDAEGSERLFVSVGAPSNACQRERRTSRSPGLDPCPQLDRHGGIWHFDPSRPGQTQAEGLRFATGMRHVLALAVHPGSGRLFGAMNGRDQLHSLWGYTLERNAELPAEEFFAIDAGDDFGWPYCYHDGLVGEEGGQGRKVLAPEYGGDGSEVGRCAAVEAPDLAFPAHWAPMALAFGAGPGGEGEVAYVAFRGSWNRAPFPQQGFRVVRVPFAAGVPEGGFDTLAIGAESETQFRFTAVAVGPDGAIYVGAENAGRIWRIVERAGSAD